MPLDMETARCHIPWLRRQKQLAFVADTLEAALDELTAARARIAGLEGVLAASLQGDVHLGDPLPCEPIQDDPAISREMVAEAERHIAAYMVDVGRIASERDEAKARIAELEAEAGRLRAALGGALELLSAFIAAARLPHVEQDPRMVAARAALEGKPIPTITKDSSLDELAAWGHAVAEAANLTPERSRELLRMVREYIASEDKP